MFRSLLWHIKLFMHRVAYTSLYPSVPAGISGDHLLVACFPKSGSSFVANVLSDVLNYRMRTFSYGDNEQHFHLPAFYNCIRENTVTQQHIPATDSNIQFLKRHHFRTIVLVRNIFDECASLYDHLHRSSLKVVPCYLTEEYLSLDEDTKIGLLVDLWVPWLIRFYVSWVEAERQKKMRFRWCTYKEMVSDKTRFFRDVLAYCGHEKKDTLIETAIARCERDEERIKLNKGIRGRGELFIPDIYKERIRGFTRYYPHIDFSRIGL